MLGVGGVGLFCGMGHLQTRGIKVNQEESRESREIKRSQGKSRGVKGIKVNRGKTR